MGIGTQIGKASAVGLSAVMAAALSQATLSPVAFAAGSLGESGSLSGITADSLGIQDSAARQALDAIASGKSEKITAPTAATRPFYAISNSQPGGLTVKSVTYHTDHVLEATVFSPAMGRDVSFGYVHPAGWDKPRPTLYLFEGTKAFPSSASDLTLGGGSVWAWKGKAVEFFAGKKDVNVVLPLGVGPTLYVDWKNEDPTHGKQAWETFYTQELPPLIDAIGGGNGKHGVIGYSMGAHGAAMLAARHPDRYEALGLMSSCYYTSLPGVKNWVTDYMKGFGVDATNIFGPFSDQRWADYDPANRFEAFQGKKVYLMVEGSDPNMQGDPDSYWITNLRECTAKFAGQLSKRGVDTTVEYVPGAVHDWPLWSNYLPKAWSVVAEGLGVQE